MWRQPGGLRFRRWLLVLMQFISVLAIIGLLITGPVYGAATVVASFALYARPM